MVNKTSEIATEHSIFVSNRNLSNFKGIIDAPAFDPTQITLISNQGAIIIKGTNLSVKRLTLEKGEVDIEGKVDSIVYTKSKVKGTKEDFFKRLLK